MQFFDVALEKLLVLDIITISRYLSKVKAVEVSLGIFARLVKDLVAV